MTQASLVTPPSIDERIVYSGINWQQFKLIQAGFARSPGTRLAYYDDAIEILMPGREHEMFSRLIGFLIGLYCLEKAIEFEPTGSMTQEREGEVSVQADESYCFGTSKSIPDLVIELPRHLDWKRLTSFVTSCDRLFRGLNSVQKTPSVQATLYET